jgi:hypothetical protein
MEHGANIADLQMAGSSEAESDKQSLRKSLTEIRQVGGLV